jgi:plastocyanin
MHTVAMQLAPVLAAEKSKVPFYIAGGLLVIWALTLSLVLGLRKPDFPGNLTGQRVVSAITIVLVLGATSTAVLTAGVPEKSAAASSAAQPAPAEAPPATGAPPTATSAAPSTATSAAPSTATSAAPSTATSAAPAPASQLSLAANPGGLLKFDKSQLQANAGSVTITMANSSPLEHNVTIAQGSTVLGATPTFTGGSKSVTLTLKPGVYTFYCSVPGHRAAGMQGTLTVR